MNVEERGERVKAFAERTRTHALVAGAFIAAGQHILHSNVCRVLGRRIGPATLICGFTTVAFMIAERIEAWLGYREYSLLDLASVTALLATFHLGRAYVAYRIVSLVVTK